MISFPQVSGIVSSKKMVDPILVHPYPTWNPSYDNVKPNFVLVLQNGEEQYAIRVSKDDFDAAAEGEFVTVTDYRMQQIITIVAFVFGSIALIIALGLFFPAV